jgi:hypothetical protein
LGGAGVSSSETTPLICDSFSTVDEKRDDVVLCTGERAADGVEKAETLLTVKAATMAVVENFIIFIISSRFTVAYKYYEKNGIFQEKIQFNLSFVLMVCWFVG